MTVRRSSPCGVPLCLPLYERYDSPRGPLSPPLPPSPPRPWQPNPLSAAREGDQLWWDW
ncbi:hypothetical protein GCM10010294_42830 [Streptomyces griseoloalbus]|nr:hypothetical protein GCM10010294_42830 [Streptomyces griseoloalbus]